MRILRNLRPQHDLLLYIVSLISCRGVRGKRPCFGQIDHFVGLVGGLRGMAGIEGCNGVLEAWLSGEDGIFREEVAFVG
jgi:hypothetical protein